LERKKRREEGGRFSLETPKDRESCNRSGEKRRTILFGRGKGGKKRGGRGPASFWRMEGSAGKKEGQWTIEGAVTKMRRGEEVSTAGVGGKNITLIFDITRKNLRLFLKGERASLFT